MNYTKIIFYLCYYGNLSVYCSCIMSRKIVVYSYTYLEKYKHFTYFLNKVITTNIRLPWVLVTLTYFDYLV